MARGSWGDFTDKYGFGDGEQTEGRDFNARDNLVKLLNARLKDKVAFAYDRPGCHNACLVIVTDRREGLKPEDHLKLWLAQELKTVGLPDDVEADIDELIDEAYTMTKKQRVKKRTYVRLNLETGKQTLVER